MKKIILISSLAVFTVFILALFTSCQSSARALQIIEQNKCRDCHTIHGKGGASAPNLTNVGARRNRDYIFQQIKAPKSHNPNSDMPSFGDRLSDQDIGVLADYLSILK